jgi:hypothetical protein
VPKKYIEEGMEDCKAISMPFDLNAKLLKLSNEEYGQYARRPIQKSCRVFDVCNGGHKGQSYIPCEHDEPTHVKA